MVPAIGIEERVVKPVSADIENFESDASRHVSQCELARSFKAIEVRAEVVCVGRTKLSEPGNGSFQAFVLAQRELSNPVR